MKPTDSSAVMFQETARKAERFRVNRRPVKGQMKCLLDRGRKYLTSVEMNISDESVDRPQTSLQQTFEAFYPNDPNSRDVQNQRTIWLRQEPQRQR